MKQTKTIDLKHQHQHTCSTWTEKVDVVYSTTYDGVEIFRDNDKWYYICANGDWQYFADLREAKNFIRNWYRG